MLGAARIVVVVAACSALSACGPVRPVCDARTCAGCCGATGECEAGSTDFSCGTAGLACAACVLGERCLSGFCVRALVETPIDGGAGGAEPGDAGAGDAGVVDGGVVPTDGGRYRPAERCDQASLLLASTNVEAPLWASLADDFNGSTSADNCFFASGPDGVFRIVAPPRQATRVTVLGDMSLNLVEGPASSCLARPLRCVMSRRLAPGEVTSHIDYLNPLDAGVELFAIVDGAQGSALAQPGLLLETYDRSTDAGMSCQQPIQVAGTTTLFNQSSVGAWNDVATTAACLRFGSWGHDVVYQVAIGAGQTLSVTVTPGLNGAQGWDPAVYLLPTPSQNCLSFDAPCLAAVDDGGTSASEYLVFNNPGGARSVYVVVDSYASNGQGPFTIAFVLTP